MKRIFFTIGLLLCYILPTEAQETDIQYSSGTMILAKQGNKIAQYMLGRDYYYGEEGISQDYVQAVYWFRKAAEQGYSEAQYDLGWCYYRGIGGLLRNEVQAYSLFRKSAEQNNLYGLNMLGYCHEQGIGISINNEKAFSFYKKAAELGFSPAQNNLALCYENGKGTQQNFELAIYWYKKAAEQNLKYAQHNLGFVYQEKMHDLNQAIYWYQKAAEQKFCYSQYSLSKLLYAHKSTETLHYLLMAYENKDIEKNAKADVAKKISACYRFGVCGATKSEAEADAWNKRAAELGEPDAKEIEKWLKSMSNKD